jgi:hypothetical protein
LKKLFHDITFEEFKKHPIWTFLQMDDESGDWWMLAEDKFPLKAPVFTYICIPVRLANGKEVWAKIQNIDFNNAAITEEFLCIELEKDGRWHHLTEYNLNDKGPDNLAKFLGMSVDDVFPITYDLRPYVAGDEYPVVGKIYKTPRIRRTDEERSELLWSGKK